MSGGHFDNIQYRLDDPIDELKVIVKYNGKTRQELYDLLEMPGDERYKYLLDNIKIDFWKFNQEIWDSNLKDNDQKIYGDWRLATKQEIESHNQEKVLDYSDQEINEFKNAINILEKAKIYLERIDWYFSGDDGPEAFIKRLKKDLKEQNGNKHE